MRCGAPASTTADGRAASSASASRRPAFGAALARATASSAMPRPLDPAQAAAVAALREASASAGVAVLAFRRRGAVEGQRTLAQRRATTLAESGAVPLRADGGPGAAAQPRPPEVAPAGSVFPPGALEQLALLARRGERPSIDLSFGRDVRVTLVRAASGIEVVLEACAALRGAAEAELPALVRTLRDRGVAVARAEVRGARERALTARRPSDKRATLPPGTVAKW